MKIEKRKYRTLYAGDVVKVHSYKYIKGLLKNAKFSKKQIDYVAKMVKFHIYPSHVVSAPEITEKIYMRFIRKMENAMIRKSSKVWKKAP